MDATGRRRFWSIVLVVATIGCRAKSSPATFPSPRETLRSVGRRLSEVCSERELTAIASRGAEVLARLEPSERAALGEGYLRFQVDRPVLVNVAAPIGSVPFWLADRGFRETEVSLVNPDARWRLYRRAFDRGSIGLGVNGLDRTPSAHYVVFVRPLDRSKAGPDSGRPVVSLDEDQRASWRVLMAGPGVGAAFDASKPFAMVPEELVGATMIQPSHAARHSTRLADGRVWKTHVVSGHRPDQVAISFGADPARELVWTWRTAPEVVSSAIRIVEVSAKGDPRVVEGQSSCVEVASVLNDPVIRRHRVAVGGLEPDRTYRYALGDGTPGGWGPWQVVKTAPERGGRCGSSTWAMPRPAWSAWGRLLRRRRPPASRHGLPRPGRRYRGSW